MSTVRWRAWLRNPFTWGLALVVVGVVVGTVTLGAATRYDGPSDITCSRDFGGKQSWVSCSDTAAGAAAAGALLGDTSDVTVLSDGLLWTSRVAFVPVAAVGLWALVIGAWRIVVGSPGSPRRELRRLRRARADRARARAERS